MKFVALQTNMRGHHIDHMGVVSIVVGFPFLFTDPRFYEEAKKYYPGIDAHLVEGRDIAMGQFDWIFASQSFPNTVFVPHGNSDKGHIDNEMRLFLQPDLVLIYGQRMLDYLKEQEAVPKHYVITGNLRYQYYLKHKEFYDRLVQEEIALDSRKRVLYAPTWDEVDGTFFENYHHVLDDIPEGYQVIVKLHPYMLEECLGKVEAIRGKYEGRKDILFLTDYPIIYPLLAQMDIFVGDMSSMGYDFLAFDRPLFFYKNHAKAFNLHRCGTVVTGSVWEAIAREDTKSQVRQEVYQHTFGVPRDPAEIKREIYDKYRLRGVVGPN